ncbi:MULTISPECIES: hypothetical protein [unclassified Bradyrhizobium]|nr:MULTISPECIES: hypothetical protein [unclassified Bradyrhizobium]
MQPLQHHHEAIRALNRNVGNLPPMPGVFQNRCLVPFTASLK